MSDTPCEKSIFKKAIDWESSRVHQIELSERRAWKVAIGAVMTALLSWISLVLLLPLKESVPYLIKVNQETGAHEILTHLDNKTVTHDEVMDKYWVSNYVRAREGYDWYTLKKDYEMVGLLSSSRVGHEYAGLFKGGEAIHKKQSNRIRVRVEILSIVLNSKDIATVRFVKNTQSLDGNSSKATFVATLSYRYENPSKMGERLRLTNPLGFQIYSYRVDPEMISEGEPR